MRSVEGRRAFFIPKQSLGTSNKQKMDNILSFYSVQTNRQNYRMNTINYLKAIHVNNCYTSQDFEIDFSPQVAESFQHLILTGKNGSGKTTILNRLDNALRNNEINNPQVKIITTQKHEKLLGEALYHYLTVERNTAILKVKGPKKMENIDLETPLSQFLVQFLVNKKTEQAYAYQDGDEQVVKQIEQWFNQFEHQLKFLFDNADLCLKFNRREFNFYIQLPKQTCFDFNQLSHGYAQVISIIAEILIAKDSKWLYSNNPPGIILIDEIENHLHLELQEKILPFLTTTFPQIQFIVATHSPAVIASINNATIYDLSKHRTVNENLFV